MTSTLIHSPTYNAFVNEVTYLEVLVKKKCKHLSSELEISLALLCDNTISFLNSTVCFRCVTNQLYNRRVCTAVDSYVR